MLRKFETTQAVVIARRYTQGMSYPKLQQFEFTVVPFTRGGSRCYYNAIKAAGYNPVDCRYGSWGRRSGQNWTTGYVYPISYKKTPAQVIKHLKESHGNECGTIIVNPEVKASGKPVVRKPSKPKVMPPIGTRRYSCRASEGYLQGHWSASIQLYTVVRFKHSKRVGWRSGFIQQVAGGPFPTRNIALAAAKVVAARLSGTSVASK